MLSKTSDPTTRHRLINWSLKTFKGADFHSYRTTTWTMDETQTKMTGEVSLWTSRKLQSILVQYAERVERLRLQLFQHRLTKCRLWDSIHTSRFLNSCVAGGIPTSWTVVVIFTKSMCTINMVVRWSVAMYAPIKGLYVVVLVVVCHWHFMLLISSIYPTWLLGVMRSPRYMEVFAADPLQDSIRSNFTIHGRFACKVTWAPVRCFGTKRESKVYSCLGNISYLSIKFNKYVCDL